MTTISSSAPFYDDFDKTKNFHQILFRPGFAVQARELTQIQSILKNQIEQFGNHIFKQGSIVIPGNSRGDLAVPYAKIAPTFDSLPVNIASFENRIVRGETSGVTGIVRKAIVAEGADPITFYISYTSGGVIDEVANGSLTFQASEVLVVDGTTIKCTVQAGSGAIGVGALAYVNEGVYYVNGTFVHIDTQSAVMSKYSVTPSCHVLLKITEELVTSDDDASLLDPAQGSPNFAAPGADRFKLALELVTIPLNTAINSDYVELMRYRNGVLEEHARNPRYNELEKSLARRTYDESGDYVVNGLYGVISEDKRVSNNGGLSVDGNLDKFAVTVAPGKAYINGFEVDKIAATNFSLDKARTPLHVASKSFTLPMTYGKYVFVTHVKGNLGVGTRTQFDIYNASSPTNVSASKIGEGRIIGLDYHSGDPSSNDAIYKLFYTSYNVDTTVTTDVSSGGIRVPSTGASATILHRYTAAISAGTLSTGTAIGNQSETRTCLVHAWEPNLSHIFVYKDLHFREIPLTGELFLGGTGVASAVVQATETVFTAGQSSALFNIPVDVVKLIRDADGFFKHSYVAQKQVTINTNSTGAGSVTISDGLFRSPEVGTFLAFTSTNVVNVNLFSVSFSQTQLNIVGGPINATITVICAVEKNALAPRTKTLTAGTSNITTYTGSQRTFTLNNSDVYRITSIADGSGDITANFVLNNGQTDYFYNLSSIVLKPGKPQPTGTIVASYQYFAHSAGDFFSIDSYTSNVGYEDFVLDHKTSTGDIVDLRNILDFRATQSGASYPGTDMVVSGEWFTTPVQYYMPRYDLLVVNKDGTVQIISGTPAESPRLPNVPSNALALEQYYVPSYTKRVTDILYKRYKVERYRMTDIAKLANRVAQLEVFSTLSAVESELISYDVVDASTGLSRFKTGYLVESFNDPLTIADSFNPEFSATFDNGTLNPAMDMMICPVQINAAQSSGYVKQNNVAMLPYTEKVFAQQSVSSRVTNLNPFLVISWDGTVTVTPSSDSWIEILDLPEIVQSRTETVSVVTWVPAPVPTFVWVEPPSNDTGLTWGEIAPAAQPETSSWGAFDFGWDDNDDSFGFGDTSNDTQDSGSDADGDGTSDGDTFA